VRTCWCSAPCSTPCTGPPPFQAFPWESPFMIREALSVQEHGFE